MIKNVCKYLLLLSWFFCLIPTGLAQERPGESSQTPSGIFGTEAMGDAGRRPLSYGASVSLTRDSNYARTVSSLAANETIFDTRAFVGYQNQISRQSYSLNADVGKQFYSSSSALNSIVYRANGLWNWEYGPFWFGTASLGLDRHVASATEQLTGTRNVVRGLNLGGTAGYRLDTRWSLVGGLDYGSTDNSSAVLQGANARNWGSELGLRYQPATALDGTFVLRHMQGKYDNLQAFDAFGVPLGVAINNDYSEDRLFLRGSWKPNEISGLSGNIGYSRRKYDSSQQRDFSGLTWGLNYSYSPFANWSGTVNFARDISNQGVVFASHVDSRTLNLGLTWQATGKIVVLPSVGLVQRVYSGDASASGVAQGKSNTVRAMVRANYNFSPGLLLNASLSQERRSAGAGLNSYSATQVSLGAQFRF